MNATLEFLGLTEADYTAPPPAEWNPETLARALRRLRALAGAQIRLRGGHPNYGGGKNAILCGRERTIGGGELLVEHVEWQVDRLYVIDGGDLFDRVLADLIAIDVAALPVAAGEDRPGGGTGEGWPASLELELVSADGAAVRVHLPDVGGDQPLAAAVRSLMAAIDAAVQQATPFRSRGPRIGPELADCFAEVVRRALLDTVRRRRGDWFAAALAGAAGGNLAVLDELARPWPPTNSGIELAQGDAALFLLGAAPRHLELWPWHRHPGQPGSRLRRLVELATARPW